MYKINPNNVPKHVAIILDGNGRWAQRQGLSRSLGHRKGALNLRDTVQNAIKLGIEYLTVYCFSTENWNRPKEEVDYLMNQPIKYFKKYKKKIFTSGIKVKILGRKERFSQDFLSVIDEVEKNTKHNDKLTLSLCIDYGSTFEIVSATKDLVRDVIDKKINIDQIDENLFQNYLYTKDLPKLDLLIRTSGEVRISNFLLYQLAYTELYFTEALWPDFDENELQKAIYNFQNRKRRFGGLKEE